ncbi:MAG TPA: DUF2254 family protein [Acidocella sp.]|uniref:DUF2254 domain-containing protein n=1 Tax=Acidocella sp. TaxID=50710 RepID=UPI002C34F0C3|nr:DUF2254 family protein [Acidocella sp.]HVE23225.1 DUF2254 family protein [Acidocella sp.]
MKIRQVSWQRLAQWQIPMVYIVAGLIVSFVLPRLEQAYFGRYMHEVSVNTAIAFFSAVSSGMMALTGIVFAIAFVVVQFSALAYSPRLVLVFTQDSKIFHTLGIFFCTFIYSLAALVWTDRNGSGNVPAFSAVLVMLLLVVSMVLFARMIQSVNTLQINAVLRTIGDRGRAVIDEMFGNMPAYTGEARQRTRIVPAEFGPPVQTLVYLDEPLVIAKLEIAALVRLAAAADAILVLECGVGETLVVGTTLLNVYHAPHRLPETSLMRCIRLRTTRTYEQDPRYAIRLLVDIAIRALSPAVNDPTTAVQALDQIEDLLRRLGRCQLEAGEVMDARGMTRLVVPVPTWQDYLSLSFDEIRQYGANSVQVVRRLRAVLVGLAETVRAERRDAVLHYIAHLDLSIGRTGFDAEDKASALEEDRQGLGMSRKRGPGGEVKAAQTRETTV